MARHTTPKTQHAGHARRVPVTGPAVFLLLAVLTAGCATTPRAEVVPAPDGGPHRLRFADGRVSLNDLCMIRLANDLNPAIPPLYVNGRPVGFC